MTSAGRTPGRRPGPSTPRRWRGSRSSAPSGCSSTPTGCCPVTPEPRTTPLPPELPGAMFDAGDVPLLLLPVRLETRFSATTLQIRVFPDQIHVDAHLPRLSAREQALGAAFWTRRRAGDADGAREDLARRVGARRAAWVARETRPAPGGAGARP